MSEAKYCEGPFDRGVRYANGRYVPIDDEAPVIVISSPIGDVAYVANAVPTERQQWAMACLLAAAPDLLASLVALRAIIHDDLTHARQRDHAAAIDAADAAIAKAGGAE